MSYANLSVNAKVQKPALKSSEQQNNYVM